MSQISYPHPVIGNGDDVAIGHFQPIIEYSITEESVELVVENLKCHNPTVETLVDEGQAIRSVQIHCARTYFRASRTTAQPRLTWMLNGEDLEGRVAVTITVVAADDIGDYLPAGAHEDYGDAPFTLRQGEVLAVCSGATFHVDKEYDPLKAPVASLMKISEGEHSDGPFRTVFEEDLLEIRLSKADWRQYPPIRDRVPALLHSIIVLPVLAEAFRRADTSVGLLWADRLLTLAEHHEIDTSDPLRAAQEILDGPLARSLREVNRELDRE